MEPLVDGTECRRSRAWSHCLCSGNQPRAECRSILRLKTRLKDSYEQTYPRPTSSIGQHRPRAVLCDNFRHHPVLGIDGMVPVVHPSKDALILVDSLANRCYSYTHTKQQRKHNDSRVRG